MHYQKEDLEINPKLERLAATHHQREIGSINREEKGSVDCQGQGFVDSHFLLCCYQRHRHSLEIESLIILRSHLKDIVLIQSIITFVHTCDKPTMQRTASPWYLLLRFSFLPSCLSTHWCIP